VADVHAGVTNLGAGRVLEDEVSNLQLAALPDTNEAASPRKIELTLR
jgi:hypothetical protein